MGAAEITAAVYVSSRSIHLGSAASGSKSRMRSKERARVAFDHQQLPVLLAHEPLGHGVGEEVLDAVVVALDVQRGAQGFWCRPSCAQV